MIPGHRGCPPARAPPTTNAAKRRCALLPKWQNDYAKTGSAAAGPDPYLPRNAGVPPMNVALGLVTFAGAIVLAIPTLGPMLMGF
jgi:hypothetical protein